MLNTAASLFLFCVLLVLCLRGIFDTFERERATFGSFIVFLGLYVGAIVFGVVAFFCAGALVFDVLN